MIDESVSQQPEVSELPVILADNVRFSYMHPETGAVEALSGVSLMMQRGKHVALLGRNGSGKSTMAKMINVLELPQSGQVLVLVMNTLS